MKIREIAFSMFAVGIISSCSSHKTGLRPKTFDLEKYLTVDNNFSKISLLKEHSGHLHINATVNGVKGSFILDTGAGATVIDPKHINKFNLITEQTNIKGAGAGGETKMKISSNNLFFIGDIEKRNFTIYLMNLDHVNTALVSMGLSPVDGVIGADVLTENKGVIDYSTLTLYLKK